MKCNYRIAFYLPVTGRIWLVLTCFLCLRPVGLQALDRYVSTNGASIAPYTNWADAATNIQWAVNAAAAGETVLVSNGIYYLTNQITFIHAITVRSATGTNATIVNGNYPTFTNRCFYITNATTIDGFTITNGYANNDVGGGVYLKDGTLQNCVITGNRAVKDFGYGGGVYFISGTVSNCQIIGNSVSNTIGGFENCGGGGVYQEGGLLTYSLVYTNRVYGTNSDNFTGWGGGVFMSGGTLECCTIAYNVSCYGAGGIFLKEGAMYNSTICGNHAPNRGAGIYTGNNGNPHIYNCLVISNRNTSAAAGGVQLYGGTLHNCTVVRNSSTVRGGIFLYNATAENTISYYNTGADWAVQLGTERVTNCCGSTGILLTNYGPNNITNAPLFADTNTSNYRLAVDSPCVNKGINRGWMANALDKDGHCRIDRFSGIADMGCYEYLPSGMIMIIK